MSRFELRLMIYKKFILSYTEPFVRQASSEYLFTSLMALAWQIDVIRRISASLPPEDIAYEGYCADALDLINKELARRVDENEVKKQAP